MEKFVKCIILTIVFLGTVTASAQEKDIPVRDEGTKKPQGAPLVHRLDFGAGFGLDYGGILGIQAGFAPVNHLTVFAAGGYYIEEFGWNVGLKGLILPKTTRYTARPFLKAMYGCNSIILVDGASYYNEVYRGFTAGAGVELRFGKKKSNGLDLDLNVPIRTSEFWDDWNEVKNDPTLDVIQDPLPVAFSVGYHFEF